MRVCKLKRSGFKKCTTADKIMFTEDLAKLKADRLSIKGRYMRAYRCQFCNAWHLTHKKRYRW